jgi:hypothetical protein
MQLLLEGADVRTSFILLLMRSILMARRVLKMFPITPSVVFPVLRALGRLRASGN